MAADTAAFRRGMLTPCVRGVARPFAAHLEHVALRGETHHGSAWLRARRLARCLAMAAFALLCAGCQAPDEDSAVHAGKGHHMGKHGGYREQEARLQAQVQAQTPAAGQAGTSPHTAAISVAVLTTVRIAV